MKNKILISTVFISNIIFASVLPLESNKINFNKNFNTFSSTVSLHLYKRGLEKKVAQEKVSQFLMGGDFENDLMVQNILNNFERVNYEGIVSYIAQATLHSKKVDLSSYESIIGVLQKIDYTLVDKQTLAKIEKVSLVNEKIRVLYGS